MLRHPPVDAFEQMAKLGRRARARALSAERPAMMSAMSASRDSRRTMKPEVAVAADDENPLVHRSFVTVNVPL